MALSSLPAAAHRSSAFVATLLATALIAGCSGAEPEAAVETPPENGILQLTEAQVASAGLTWRPVSPAELRQTVQVPGSVDAPDTARAMVGAILEGRVARIRVLPGDRVRAGQTLVEIHGHELFDAQAALASAEADLEVAREASGRAERLYAAGAIALEELQRREGALTRAEAEVTRAQEMVEHLYPTPDGNASAVAPNAGTVFSVEVEVGQVVLPGTPLVHMGTTDRLWVTAFVPEGTSARLDPGEEVAVRFQAAPNQLGRARLVRTGQYVDPSNRSVEMRFELLEVPAGVRPGSFATVLVSTSGGFQGVELPEAAAVRLDDGDAVFLSLGDGRFEARLVTVMPLGEGRVAVEGVEEGAQVVVEGAYFLKSTLEAAGAEGGPDSD